MNISIFINSDTLRNKDMKINKFLQYNHFNAFLNIFHDKLNEFILAKL